MDHIQDCVNIELTVEEAIVSDTVKVSLNVVLATKAEEATDVRGTITSALKNILDVDWAFTRLDRSTNRSGLEEVEATATARVQESSVAGIATRAKDNSAEGLQITVGELDYNPARNVIDETIVRLRKTIYQKAMEEIATLNEVAGFANTEWRLGSVNFYQENGIMPKGNFRGVVAASYAAMDSHGGCASLDLTQKVSLTANVALQRLVV